MGSQNSGAHRKRPPQRERSRQRRAHIRKVNRYIRITGRIAVILQALLSLILVIQLIRSGMFPGKYIIAIVIVLVILTGITLYMNLRRKRRLRIAGIAVSVVVIILVLTIGSYLSKTLGLLSGADDSYKTDNMIVVVRSDDDAEDLKDVRDYTFGLRQSSGSEAMIEDIENQLGSSIKTREYDSEIEVGQALVAGDVNAAIYNEAYTDIIAGAVDDYEDQVKTVYHYGIQTDIAEESVDAGEPFNLLISGIDVHGDISKTSRSDVNIIVTVNPQTKKILLTSTPRDYYVYIPGVSGEQRDKLTHAGIYGVDASMRTLENLYDINISYFLRVNFDTLIDLVDALDGIDVYVPYTFDAYTADYHFDKGWHHMNGKEALAFCRERYSFSDGDNQRGRDQEQVLKAILEKMTSSAVITNASGILDSLSESFQTNMPESKIAELIQMQLSDGASWDISKQTAAQGESELTTTYSGGSTPLYVMWPDDASVKTNSVRIDMIGQDTSYDEDSGVTGTGDENGTGTPGVSPESSDTDYDDAG